MTIYYVSHSSKLLFAGNKPSINPLIKLLVKFLFKFWPTEPSSFVDNSQDNPKDGPIEIVYVSSKKSPKNSDSKGDIINAVLFIASVNNEVLNFIWTT